MTALLPKMLVTLTLTVLLITGGCVNTLDAVRMNRQAQVYFNHNDYDNAEQLLQQSLDVDFENPASHYWLGRCYQVKGNQAKEIRQYRLAAQFAPSMELAQMALIMALHRTGQTEKSLQATEQFLAHKEAPATDFLRLAADFDAQDMPRHLVLASKAAANAEPHNPKPLLFLADYYFEKDDADQGLEYLVKAFKVDPVYPGLARRLGEHGLRVDIPQPTFFPPPRSKVEQEIFELKQ